MVYSQVPMSAYDVAPFAGAWIEISDVRYIVNTPTVAPFAGAWIEMPGMNVKFRWQYVAPFAGAWIEIYS